MARAAHPTVEGNGALDLTVGDGNTGRAPRHRSRWARWLTLGALTVLSTVFFLYLLVPLLALLFHAPPQDIWHQMTQPDVRDALVLSFVTTAISTVLAVIFGLPAAIVLARGSFRGHRLLETLATIPTVLPP